MRFTFIFFQSTLVGLLAHKAGYGVGAALAFEIVCCGLTACYAISNLQDVQERARKLSLRKDKAQE